MISMCVTVVWLGVFRTKGTVGMADTLNGLAELGAYHRLRKGVLPRRPKRAGM